jgi:hypothetical protein
MNKLLLDEKSGMKLYQTMKVVADTTPESGEEVMSDLTADNKTHNGKSRMLRGMCVKECDMISSLDLRL